VSWWPTSRTRRASGQPLAEGGNGLGTALQRRNVAGRRLAPHEVTQLVEHGGQPGRELGDQPRLRDR
jgi:hypothetical protein